MLASREQPVEAWPPLPHVPRHVAIIMDGNGRWAQARGLPRLAGHRAGTENTRRIIEACVEFGVPMLTLYAFSTENWYRPREEVDGLLAILAEVIDRELAELHANGVRLRHLGSPEGLPETLRQKVQHAVDLTRHNTRLTLNVAFNYGGRAEILQAVRRILADGIRPEEVTEELFASYLHTAGMPDPDLIIRTAGEMRLSNFLLWQAAYAEYFSTPKHWPDFSKEDFYLALCAYSQRQRRFGRVLQ
ncbi:MAG TPA: polyprenyl diphosphate synthase [Chloroflexota bacterium]|jgi:undecaprenyl diphosphate synthase|nr:polyprenyl diphosphate synthase [Chloroflexota bacterium]